MTNCTNSYLGQFVWAVLIGLGEPHFLRSAEGLLMTSVKAHILRTDIVFFVGVVEIVLSKLK